MSALLQTRGKQQTVRHRLINAVHCLNMQNRYHRPAPSIGEHAPPDFVTKVCIHGTFVHLAPLQIRFAAAAAFCHAARTSILPVGPCCQYNINTAGWSLAPYCQYNINAAGWSVAAQEPSKLDYFKGKKWACVRDVTLLDYERVECVTDYCLH